jgi:uncharacterized protein (DUF983 family)
MTTYRHNTVERCVKCQIPWAGWGLVCNDCRQIEALENVAKSNKQASSQSYSGSGISISPAGNLELIFSIIIIGLFIYGNYLLNWIPLKIMWWVVSGIASIVASFF